MIYLSVCHTYNNHMIVMWVSQHVWITPPHCMTLQKDITGIRSRVLLENAATHCNTLQHTATQCNTLQHTAKRKRTHHMSCTTRKTATHCNTLRHTATRKRTHYVVVQRGREHISFGLVSIMFWSQIIHVCLKLITSVSNRLCCHRFESNQIESNPTSHKLI